MGTQESPCIELVLCHYMHIHRHIQHALTETNTIPRRLLPEWRCQSEITMTGCRVEVNICNCVCIPSQSIHTDPFESLVWWLLIDRVLQGGQKWPRGDQQCPERTKQLTSAFMVYIMTIKSTPFSIEHANLVLQMRTKSVFWGFWWSSLVLNYKPGYTPAQFSLNKFLSIILVANNAASPKLSEQAIIS